MTPISFKANFIRYTTIKQWDNKSYNPTEASFVEFIPQNKNDLQVLDNISKRWDEAIYAQTIYNSAFIDSVVGQKPNHHFYGITTQKNNLSKPDTQKVLGIAEVTEKINKNEIAYLQTKPDYMSKANKSDVIDLVFSIIDKISPNEKEKEHLPEYKNIGTGIINSLKETYPNKDIELYATDTAKGFYKKLGFVKCSFFNSNHLFLKHNKNI